MLLLGLAPSVFAQTSSTAAVNFPSKPLKIVVPFGAGGIADLTARTVGAKMADILGQPVVIDNKPGAGGIAAGDLVAKSEPDGTTLLLMSNGTAVSAGLFKSLPYDPEADFIPISRLVNQPMVLIVKDKQKYPTVAALLAAAKAAPGKITYASSGDGSPQHLAGLMFESRTQTKLLHVPYRGGALAINDTIAGTVDAMFAVMPEAVPHVQSGKLHALGVMSPTRSPVFPQVPTMAESGVVDLNLSAWMALLAPAKTPRAIVDQLNRAVQSAFDPELKAKLAESGIEVATSTPEDAQRLIARDIKLHAELVKAAGLVPQ